MNMIEFIEKVRLMRQAHNAYFRSRLQSDLVSAKRLEKEVDAALEEGVTIHETHTLEEQMPIDEQIQMFERDAGDLQPDLDA